MNYPSPRPVSKSIPPLAEVMEDDTLLEVEQRYWWREKVAQAWEVTQDEAGSRN
ncbi:hypothetical protein [Leptolyngbya sp. FACHB-17]|uniref:hypothetical protein n=1 Tax=unclassified Leptolyngbya TaxID=2650499 RepID=UPI001680D72D|nr:hypothetical protein [Leptolyngbya sp. FACHB-17]MBD2079961.1 hypothetical protein [Leptolyngbya sp. FACHB-17]